MGKLTAQQVSRIKEKGLYGDGGCLYLQVTASGTKSWVFRFRKNKKLRDHGLGSSNTLTLAEAREAALECRKLRLQGIDPIDHKNKHRVAAKLEAAKAVSFADCAEAYITSHKSGWKSAKHAGQWTATLTTYAYPVFGDLPVAAIDVGLVMKAVEPIWTTKSETAARLRGRIEAILDYAKVCGYREGENPALWKGNLSHLLPQRSKVKRVQHHKALPHAEMSAFWADLAEQAGTGAKALRFTILTAARTSEVLEATWDEVDLDNAVWTLSVERMKAGRVHRVPLSAPAVALLRELKKERTGDYVFPGAKAGRPLSNMSLTAVLKRMGRTDITTHGFRSTFRDWAAEKTDTPREVAEAALAHTLESKVEAAYRRSDLFDKRRGLMADWAGYCTEKSKGLALTS